uniref:DUF4097 domain-containing protein n=1 Tax=Mola mola TaxID=94237 RepID=A0A3Q3WX03_MOLML
MKRWALEVNPFSTVRAQLGCSIAVRPLDPHTFPEADRAFITVHGAVNEQEAGLDHMQVQYDDQSQELLISAQKVNSSVTIDLAAPIKLFITTQGKGNVQVKKMECDICKVQTEKGNCLLQSVKGHQIEVRSLGGHIKGEGTIHGNVDISTCGDSSLDVKKLQGTKMNVSTEHGPLKVKAIYAESSCISSCSGRIELGNVHCFLHDGSNNFLRISSQSGGIDVYVGDGGSADIHTQEVCVRVPSSLKARVELCGASVDVSTDVVLHGEVNSTTEDQTTVTYVNGESPVDQWVKAQADRGSVRLKAQSWFETL